MGIVEVGVTVRTSYGSGPYVVTKVHGPCRCASYLSELNDLHPQPSPSHYHLSCEKDGEGGFLLNGYTLEGKSVWCADQLLIDSPQVPVQQGLFGEARIWAAD